MIIHTSLTENSGINISVNSATDTEEVIVNVFVIAHGLPSSVFAIDYVFTAYLTELADTFNANMANGLTCTQIRLVETVLPPPSATTLTPSATTLPPSATPLPSPGTRTLRMDVRLEGISKTAWDNNVSRGIDIAWIDAVRIVLNGIALDVGDYIRGTIIDVNKGSAKQEDGVDVVFDITTLSSVGSSTVLDVFDHQDSLDQMVTTFNSNMQDRAITLVCTGVTANGGSEIPSRTPSPSPSPSPPPASIVDNPSPSPTPDDDTGDDGGSGSGDGVSSIGLGVGIGGGAIVAFVGAAILMQNKRKKTSTRDDWIGDGPGRTSGNTFGRGGRGSGRGRNAPEGREVEMAAVGMPPMFVDLPLDGNAEGRRPIGSRPMTLGGTSRPESSNGSISSGGSFIKRYSKQSFSKHDSVDSLTSGSFFSQPVGLSGMGRSESSNGSFASVPVVMWADEDSAPPLTDRTGDSVKTAEPYDHDFSGPVSIDDAFGRDNPGNMTDRSDTSVMTAPMDDQDLDEQEFQTLEGDMGASMFDLVRSEDVGPDRVDSVDQMFDLIQSDKVTGAAGTTPSGFAYGASPAGGRQ